MAKGGNNQRSNGSRLSKSYNASNSFVTKVATRVSDYLGGWFGSPLKFSKDAEASETIPSRTPGNATEKLPFENVEPRRSTLLSHRVFDDVEALSSPAKRFKVSEKERIDIDFPVSPIPSTSGLYRGSVNHTFDVSSAPGPSDPRREKFGRNTDDIPDVAPHASTTTTDMKANGATDNHSDSSESTSGCSSLVPQSDRLSQSAYVCSTRKRNLEDKLKYARRLQQSRTSLYLNRSIPINNAPGTRKKPSFDVTAYGSPTLDKTLLRERLINSPFYTGQTSYGGASAYRLSKNTFYSQRNSKFLTEKREGLQVQVKPSHHGSTEDLSNMSHTAKKILEALEQFSTPVNDAKRIPVSRSNVPLGLKRRRFDDLSETRLRLSTPISPLNPNPGPVITGLNVPTVPDLLKLKRLERIQDSTSAARQVAVQKQEYSLPSEGTHEKQIGKIVTKLKNRKKDGPLEKLEEVNLPKIPLPITSLPKFEFELPPVKLPAEDNTDKPENPKARNFVFSPPIAVFVKELPEGSTQKSNFKFSNPLSTDEKVSKPDKTVPESLLNFMSAEAVKKLKRKSINDGNLRTTPPVGPLVKPEPEPPKASQNGFGDLFKKQANQWECSVCMIRNKDTDSKCAACETLRPGAKPEKSEQKLSCFGVPGGGFKFGIDKAGTEEAGVKSAADSSTFQLQTNGPQPQTSAKPQQFNAISTSVGVFTFGIPPEQNKKEETKTEAPITMTETSSHFLVTSTSGSTLQKDEPQLEKKSEPEKTVETKVDKGSNFPKAETVKPFTFGSLNKSPAKLPSGSVSEIKPSEEPKTSNFSLSAHPNLNTPETVTSSTTDFISGQNKAATDHLEVGDAGSTKPPPTFHFKPFTPPETAKPKPNLPMSAENKSESAPSASGTVTTALQPTISPSSSSMFNVAKTTFGTSLTTSAGSGFTSTNSSTSNASPFGASAPSFSTSGFSSQTSASPSTNSFGMMSQSTEKPASSTRISFGSTSASFSNSPNLFASAISSAQNQETPKSFSLFGANARIPSFVSNPVASPTFGTGFVQSSTSEKPAATAPFVFGVSAPTNTSSLAPPVTAPGVFTFGSAKPESKPTFSFGQSTAPNFNFGSSVHSTNIFGGFGQSKPENSLGATTSLPFGSSTTSLFGQNSAPAFESTTSKFIFGNSSAQQQETSPSVFKFSAAPAQPATVPTGTGLSLSVPQNFNFRGGQTNVFSASPSAESSSAPSGRARKVIKAVRRTNRDPMRRPQ